MIAEQKKTLPLFDEGEQPGKGCGVALFFSIDQIAELDDEAVGGQSMVESAEIAVHVADDAKRPPGEITESETVHASSSSRRRAA